MGVEWVIAVFGLVISAAVSATGGAFWIQLKGSERIDKIKRASDDRLETMRKASDERVDRLISENKSQMEILLSHVQKVENVLNDMRAELPTKYVLREDFLRLVEKVEELRIDSYRPREQRKDA